MLTCETNPWLPSGKKKLTQKFLRNLANPARSEILSVCIRFPRVLIFFYDGWGLDYVCSSAFDYLKPPAKRARFSAINEGYVSLKKAAWRGARKRCAKMHNFAILGGSANVHEKKRAKREGLYFSEPANLYSTKNRFFSTQGIFFVFRAGRDTPRPKNKKGPVPTKVYSAFLYMRNQNFFYF
jgi:hypothetical protein